MERKPRDKTYAGFCAYCPTFLLTSYLHKVPVYRHRWDVGRLQRPPNLTLPLRTPPTATGSMAERPSQRIGSTDRSLAARHPVSLASGKPVRRSAAVLAGLSLWFQVEDKTESLRRRRAYRRAIAASLEPASPSQARAGAGARVRPGYLFVLTRWAGTSRLLLPLLPSTAAVGWRNVSGAPRSATEIKSNKNSAPARDRWSSPPAMIQWTGHP